MLKHSKQREAIRLSLQSRCDHPTADTMYREMRDLFPHISLGTVYRNLSLLCEIGEAQMIMTGDGLEHFDGNPVPHDHFRCRLCGCLIDMPVNDGTASFLSESSPKASGPDHAGGTIPARPDVPGFDGLIESCTTLYTGLCACCLTK